MNLIRSINYLFKTLISRFVQENDIKKYKDACIGIYVRRMYFYERFVSIKNV